MTKINSSKHVFVDGSTIRVKYVKQRWDGREVWSYKIRDASGTVLLKGRDLRSGCWVTVDAKEMLGTFASYLTAWLEALQYGSDYSENRDLFPLDLEPWATEHQTELEILGYDPA